MANTGGKLLEGDYPCCLFAWPQKCTKMYQ